MLPILLDWVNEGRLTLQQVVRMTSELPARLFGVRDKGGIAPGLDADLVLVDLRHRWTIERRWVESRAGWSPFEGMTISGKPIATVVGGVISLRDGEIVGTPAGRPVGYEWKE